MSEDKRSSLPAIDAWQVESLRLTSFPSPASRFSGSDWWKEVVGQEPESTTSRKAGAEQIDEGGWQDGRLRLQIRPGRIDWSVSSPAQGEAPESLFATIGELGKTVELFDNLMACWFKLVGCPVATRLAFGAVLMLPVETEKEGYDLVARYLERSVTIDPEGSSDFFYQINRPKESESVTGGLRINRLSKWSVRKNMLSGGPDLAHQTIVAEKFAIRLELDINTTADFKSELSVEQIPVVLNELIEMGKDIAAHGDIS